MKRWFVISLAFVLALPPLALAQSGTQKKDLGPRALALLQLAPDGSSRLIPVAIMYNGDFFDASAYKADPVPMALDSGNVYEAFRTGSSQGLFTVKQAVQAGTMWSARGTWQTSAAIAAAEERKKKKAAEKPPTIADDDKGPPKLLRRSNDTSDNSNSKTTTAGNKPSTDNTPPADADDDPDRPQLKRPQQSAPANAPSTPSAQSPAPSQSTQTADAKPATTPAATNTPAKPDPSEVSEENDPNRPKLERGKPAKQEKSDAFSIDSISPAKTAASPAGAKNTTIASALPGPNVIEIPAISDAGGPDPHSYIFPLKSGEEEQFRKKMLAQATQVIRAQLKEKTSEDTARASAKTARAKSAMRLPEPTYKDVNLRVFDLSSSNQPIMVLEANAQVPGRDQQHITLVTRQDLYGELHNSLANITDPKHFDVTPQMNLIDVVDADGDGRGELLFRETSDQGHAYSIYRVIGDQLYQLYESTPQ